MRGLLALKLLGGFEAFLDEKPVSAFRTNKNRALLAFLAAEADHSHSRDALAGLLWPEYPQISAMSSLRHALASVRRAIGDSQAQPPYLIINRQSVQINRVSSLQVDLWDLQRAVSALHDPDTHAGVVEASEAYLFSPPFLDGFSCGSAAFEEWVLYRREQLNRQVREKISRRMDFTQQAGDYERSIRLARRLIELDPWDEVAHRQVMAGLARLGRRSAALAHYEACRLSLLQELNVEPEHQTRRLVEAIRAGEFGPAEASPIKMRGEATHEADPAPPSFAGGPVANPAEVPPFPGEGYRLPAGWTVLVGRERELAEISARLSDPLCRLLVVIGPGGIGKTHLALEAAHLAAGRFAQGACLVSLAAVPSAEVLPHAIAQALGFSFYPGSEPAQELMDYLSRRDLLLLLDNFEHLLSAAPLVAAILQSAPRVKVLVTSRARLNLSGESVFSVDGLAFPSADLQPLESCAAVRLFLEGARRVNQSYQAAPQDGWAIGQICRAVQGLPLAILLAAGWMDVLSPAEILREMERNSLDFLASEWQDAPERQRSLRAVFDGSYRLLSAREQEVFAGLSVFHGGFTLASAQAVTGCTLRELRALVEKSLVQRSPGGRYHLHDLLGRYGAEVLARSPELYEAFHDSHAAYFAAAMSAWWQNFQGPRQSAALREFSLDLENALEAWRWMVDHSLVDRISQSLFMWVNALQILFPGTADGESQHALLQDAAGRLAPLVFTAPTRFPERTRLLVRIWFCETAYLVGSPEQAVALLRQGEGLVRQLAAGGEDTRFERALILSKLGELYAPSGNVEEFEPLFQESLALFRELGEEKRIAWVLTFWGLWRIMMDDHAGGRAMVQESLAIYRRTGNHRIEAKLGDAIREVSWQRLEFEESEGLLREILAVYQESGDPFLIATGTGNLGVVISRQGRAEEGRVLLAESVLSFERIGALRLAHYYDLFLADTELRLGRFEAAHPRILRALPYFREINISQHVAYCLLLLGGEALANGQYAESSRLLQECYRTWPANVRTPRMVSLAMLVFAEHALGRSEQAVANLREALRVSVANGELAVLLFAIPAAALLLADRGQVEKAVELVALVNRYRYAADSYLSRRMYGQKIAAMAEALPPEVIRDAQARGCARDLLAAAAELLADF